MQSRLRMPKSQLSRSHLLVSMRAGFFLSFASFALLLLPGVAAAQTSAAQPDTGHKLTLIGPNDPGFEELVAQNYPGLEDTEGYRAMNPFVALLRNDTTLAARAYVVAWDVASPGIVNHLKSQFIQRDRLAATAAPFRPGELRLVSGLFNLSPSEWKTREWAIAKFMPNWTSHLPYTSTNIQSIKASVDAVIFEDGAYDGPDRFSLLTTYQCIRAAEHDVADSVLKMKDANTTTADIVAMLERHAQAGLDAGPGTSRGDRESVCALYRGEEAQTLLGHYRKGGEEDLIVRAWAKANRPREKIVRVNQN